MLDEQYRMVPDISTIVNNLVYGGPLKNVEEVRVQDCPIAREVRKFNAVNYRVSYNVVYLNIDEATTQITDTKSRYNETYIMHALNLADQLITSLPKETSIAYLTCYQAECRAAQSGRDEMVRQNPQMSPLTIATIDSISGLQYDVVMVDLIMLGAFAGFQNLQRLCLLISRARYGLYIISTKRQIHACNKSGRHLKALQKQIVRYRANIRTAEADVRCEYYTRGQIDMNLDNATTEGRGADLPTAFGRGPGNGTPVTGGDDNSGTVAEGNGEWISATATEGSKETSTGAGWDTVERTGSAWTSATETNQGAW